MSGLFLGGLVFFSGGGGGVAIQDFNHLHSAFPLMVSNGLLQKYVDIKYIRKF